MTPSAHTSAPPNHTRTMRFYPSNFTGKEKDEETGYGYFGARYMDHELMAMWLIARIVALLPVWTFVVKQS